MFTDLYFRNHITLKGGLTTVAVLVLTSIFLACAIEERPSIPAKHVQEEGENYRLCLDCHDAGEGGFPFIRFVHTSFFADDHRMAAIQDRKVCSMCHASRHCEACHGVGIELTPSRRDPTGVYQRSPHRGDYLSRHRIDGRMDPFSCRRCHGNPKSALSCKPCHG